MARLAHTLWVTVLMSAAVTTSAATARAGTSSPSGSLERLVKTGAPGALLLTRHGGTTTATAVGRNDLRRGTRLRARSSFRIGSLTKTFVASVVLQLASEGRVSLGDRVSTYLGAGLPGADTITLRQLLQHTSGLPDFDGLEAVTQPYLAGDLQFVWSPQALIDLATAQPPLFAPGARFAYSNTNYLVAGLVVEAVTHRPLAAVLRDRIFRPLGLRHTVFALRGTQPAPQVHGYTIVGASRIDVTTLTPYSWAAGAIVSTAGDVATFYRALLAGRVVAKPLLRSMLTTVADTNPDVAGQRYGLGIARFPTRCGIAWGHNGDTAGYLVFAFTSRDASRQAVLFLSEDAESLPQGTGRVFLSVLEGAYCGA
jgi:D-alanyl-D-alanine carboxypeptidase